MFEICILLNEGQYHIFDTGYPGLSMDKNSIPQIKDIEADFGQTITSLVGSEHIRRGIWHFNSETGLVEKLTSINPKGYTSFALENSGSFLQTNVLLDGILYRMIIDTGSTVSYLGADKISGNLNLVHKDAVGFSGTSFEVLGRKYKASAFGKQIEISVFIPPSRNVPNILGANFIMKFEWILDTANNTIWVK